MTTFLALLAPALLALQTPQEEPASAPQPAKAVERVALVGGRVHSMVPGEAPRTATILIEDGKIAAIEPGLELAAGTVRLDIAGKHVVPGLIDAYVNFDPDHDALYVASGVTTIRDVGGEFAQRVRERRPERRDRVPGPTLITAGALLDGDPPSSRDAVVLRDAAAAQAYLPLLFQERVDFLSVFFGVPEDAWKKTIELAHEKELQVWGPVPSATTLPAALAAGQDGFHFLDGLLPEGGMWDSSEPSDFDARIQALSAARRPLVPLFHASSQRLENQLEHEQNLKLLALLAPSYEVWWKAELSGRMGMLSGEHMSAGRRAIEAQAGVLRRLHASGVPLVPGSGAPSPWLFPGQSLHLELARWVKIGMEPADVLALATRGAAEALGIADERGTLAVGRAADLVVTAGDPTADLATLVDPEMVVVRGRVLERADLDDLLAGVAEAVRLARVELERPLEIAPPDIPQGGVVVLEGLVESESLGQRVSGERFRIARFDDGSLIYAGRVAYPRSVGGETHELTIEQLVKDDALTEVHVALRQGASVFELRGIWTAGTWRMQTQLDGRVVGSVQTASGHPACAEISSVTSLLILAQEPLGERVPVLYFHAGLESEYVNWRTELDDNGDHQIRTHVGRKALRLNELGAPELVLSQVGSGVVRTHLVSCDAFGGPGHPLPAGKRKSAAKAPAANEESLKPGGASESDGK